MYRIRCVRILLIIALILASPIIEQNNAKAQECIGVPLDPGCDPNCPNPSCPPQCQCIPIDGGLGLLLAVGIGVGVWRGRRRQEVVYSNL